MKQKTLFSLFILLCSVTFAHGQDCSLYPEALTGKRVHDFQSRIDDSVEEKIEALLSQHASSTEVAVVISNSIAQQDREIYVRGLANCWGVGHQTGDNGLIVFVATQDKKWHIMPGKGIHTYLSNERVKQIAQLHFVPYLKENNITKAVSETVPVLIQEIEYNKHRTESVAVEKTQVQDQSSAFDVSSILTYVVLFFLLVFLISKLIDFIASRRASREEAMQTIKDLDEFVVMPYDITLWPSWAVSKLDSIMETYEYHQSFIYKLKTQAIKEIQKIFPEAEASVQGMKESLRVFKELRKTVDGIQEEITLYETSDPKLRSLLSMLDTLEKQANSYKDKGFDLVDSYNQISEYRASILSLLQKASDNSDEYKTAYESIQVLSDKVRYVQEDIELFAEYIRLKECVIKYKYVDKRIVNRVDDFLKQFISSDLPPKTDILEKLKDHTMVLEKLQSCCTKSSITIQDCKTAIQLYSQLQSLQEFLDKTSMQIDVLYTQQEEARELFQNLSNQLQQLLKSTKNAVTKKQYNGPIYDLINLAAKKDPVDWIRVIREAQNIKKSLDDVLKRDQRPIETRTEDNKNYSQGSGAFQKPYPSIRSQNNNYGNTILYNESYNGSGDTSDDSYRSHSSGSSYGGFDGGGSGGDYGGSSDGGSGGDY